MKRRAAEKKYINNKCTASTEMMQSEKHKQMQQKHCIHHYTTEVNTMEVGQM